MMNHNIDFQRDTLNTLLHCVYVKIVQRATCLGCCSLILFLRFAVVKYFNSFGAIYGTILPTSWLCAVISLCPVGVRCKLRQIWKAKIALFNLLTGLILCSVTPISLLQDHYQNIKWNQQLYLYSMLFSRHFYPKQTQQKNLLALLLFLVAVWGRV